MIADVPWPDGEVERKLKPYRSHAQPRLWRLRVEVGWRNITLPSVMIEFAIVMVTSQREYGIMARDIRARPNSRQRQDHTQPTPSLALAEFTFPGNHT